MSVHVPNCKSFLATKTERKDVKRRATSSFFLLRQGAEGNSRHSDRNIRENTPSCATVKPGWPSLNVVIFPPVMRLVLDDPKQ